MGKFLILFLTQTQLLDLLENWCTNVITKKEDHSVDVEAFTNRSAAPLRHTLV